MQERCSILFSETAIPSKNYRKNLASALICFHIYVRTQVHLRDGEDPRRELLLTGGSDRALLRGHDLRDAPPPPSHTRLHRAYSESVAAMGGSRGRAGDGRHQGVQHTSPGVSPHIRPRDVPSSSHHQLQSQRHTFMDQKLASSASSQGHGHGPVHHSQLNGGNRSHPMLNGDTGGGVGKGGYDYEYHGNHQGVSHQQVPSLHRGLSTPTLGSSGGSIASGNSRRGLPIHVDDPDIDHGYILDSHGLGSGGGPGSGITNNDQGGRSGSSAPSSSSFMSSRQGRTNSRSDGRGGGGGRRGGYGNGGGPSYVSDRYKSSSSPSEVYRDDISHTVRSSCVQETPSPSTENLVLCMKYCIIICSIVGYNNTDIAIPAALYLRISERGLCIAFPRAIMSASQTGDGGVCVRPVLGFVRRIPWRKHCGKS